VSDEDQCDATINTLIKQEEQNMQEAMFFCEECGAANIDQATSCFACNEPLVKSLSPSAAAPAAPSTPVAFTPIPVGNGAFAFKLAEPQPSAPSQAAGPLTPGSVLAWRYRIVEQVGQGGFGVVYKAKDARNGDKLVAIKQINLDNLSARDMIQATDSYNREVNLMPPLKHKNLPRFYAHFTDPRHWYLVMDYIQGETLEEYLKRAPDGKLPMEEVLTIGAQLCDVLLYLHQKHGIVFRDVKPANVMRARNGRIYLIDFGIARRFIPGKAKDTIPLGSPGYAAPEQYGTRQTSAQTDIYGLGATLLTLLTGVDAAETADNAADSSAHTDTAQTPALPPRVQQLLDQMLAWDASQRPKNMQVVRKRLLVARDGVLGRISINLLTFFTGAFIGALPYLLFLASFVINYYTPYGYYGALTCFLPLLGLGEFITGVVFLFQEKRRLIGLGLLAMLILLMYLAASGQLWVPPFFRSY
jgi:hypothetical protein